jgi:glycosyltransferase involved in cell wall biosynthesis
VTVEVSVIIPCFNAERTVGETIESVLKQTRDRPEIIVVDDGSTDTSPLILRGFKDRITVESGPNRGASAARNNGLALATGDYIQFLDADDLLGPNAIESRVLALEASEADVAYGDWRRFEVSDDGLRHLGEIVDKRMEDIDADAEIACATEFWAPPVALLYRRRIVDAIGSWHEGLPVIQDARFLFDAARHGAKFIHVPGISAFYRSAGVSLSRGNQRAFLLDVYRNAIEIQSLWESDGPLTNARNAALAGIFDMTARSFFRLGMTEFEDAVLRFRSLSGRRFGYPEIAYRISQVAGRGLAASAMAAGSHVARGLLAFRSLRQ